MNIIKIAAVFALTFMTIISPVTNVAIASHHSSDMIIFDDDFWKGDNYKKKKYQDKAKKIAKYQEAHESKSSGGSKHTRKRSKKINKSDIKIKVNTKKNRIYLYEKINGEWVKIKEEKCCTGRDGATPKGSFTTDSKEKSFTKGDYSYNYVTYFEDNYAIHSTPYDGEYHNSSLGHSRSHGCVRVKPETAQWIYENVRHGTTVEIE